ncbi:MAG: alpha/beta hydrolase [Paludibacteraceae bacterium]|nr:alpha/beta hydrolase [Paludibacteraceae bacterium]
MLYIALAVIGTIVVIVVRKQATTINELHTIDVNGVNLTYLIKGAKNGKPVLLLHGNGGHHGKLKILTNQLAQAGYLVYAPDSRGQGANAPLEEYHYIDMAEDMYQMINLLHLGKPVVYGWSDGGIIALQMEVIHPGTVSAIVTSGANIFPEDCGDDFLNIDSVREAHKDDPPLFKMMLYEPNMTAEDMQTIQCPSLIISGENDLIYESHTRLIAENIPNGEAMILPGEDHGSYIRHSRKMGRILIPYLKKIGY